MADSQTGPSTEDHEAQKSLLEDAKQPLVGPARGDGEAAGTDAEKGSADKGRGGEPSTRSTLFNWRERPDQDVLFGRIFVVAMVLLLIREIAAFFWPILSLRFLDPANFSLDPLLSILLGLAITVPGCFALLWTSRNLRAPVVQICLVLCVAFFVLSLVGSLAFHQPPNPGTEESEEYPGPGGRTQPGDMRALPGHRPAGALGDETETSLLEAAIPGSISRILRVTSSFSPEWHERRFKLALHSDSPPSPSTTHTVAKETRRMLAATSRWVASGSMARRVLRSISLVQADHLSQAETVLNDLLNGGMLLLILFHCSSLFPLVALIISDSAKFVLTRGRGLVFAVLALVGAMVLTSLPAISVALQVGRACQGDSSSIANPIAQPNEELCRTWKAALLDDILAFSPLPILGLFLASWFVVQVQYLLQFIAAHVVGQCYGNTRASMDEDDVHSVIRAAKCAFKESFGSVSLLSLVSTAVFGGSVVLNMLVMELLGSSVVAAVPLLLISTASFAFSLFLACFVLPLVALTGQSFKDAMHSAIALVQQNVVPAVAVTLSSISVVGVFIFFILAATVVVALVAGFILAGLGGLAGVGFMMWVMLLVLMVFGTSACALTLFHWVFSTTISSLFLCLVLEGKAKESTLSTPLAPEE